jgi:hypothetical protein
MIFHPVQQRFPVRGLITVCLENPSGSLGMPDKSMPDYEHIIL